MPIHSYMNYKLMIKHIILSVLWLLPFVVQAQTDPDAESYSASPASYNNYIVAVQGNLMDKVVEYIVETVHNENYREVESKRLEVIAQIEASIATLKRMEPFKGDDQMRKEALEVFELYREAYVNDYSQINMLKKDRESSFKAMERYFEAQDLAEKKLQRSADQFEQAQKDFADRHNITITEMESDGTMGMIAKVNRYSRKVFLEFFRISKLNGQSLDALNSRDTIKIEETRIALLKGAQQAWENLKQTSSFKGDDEYRSRTMAFVAYHELFAKNELKELCEILGKESRSNEDIDRYNEIIQTYNTDIKTLIRNFNEANIKLLRKHIPNTSMSFKEPEQKG